MKDKVEIVKVNDKMFEITRTIVDKVDRLSLEDQLKSLQHSEEQYIDQLESVRERMKNIAAALELTQNNDKVEGKGVVVNLKKD